MAHLVNRDVELNEDFLLALKLSEGVDQFGRGDNAGQELDEDYILALKLSEESYQPNPGDDGDRMDLDEDFLLAVKLSESFGQSGGDSGQVETDAAFARRLAQELNGRASPEDPGSHESPMASGETSTNVAILRDWYSGSHGEAPNLTDLFQHLNFLDNAMLRERTGLRFTAVAKEAPNPVRRRSTGYSPRPSGTGFRTGTFPAPNSQTQLTRTHDPNVDRMVTSIFDFLSTNLDNFAGDVNTGQGRRAPVRPIVSAMLDLSLFSETIEMVLRSDSITHLADSLNLVKALLRLLKAISLRDEYKGILTRPRRLKKRTKGLQGIAQSLPGTPVTSVILLEDEKEPKSQPLFSLLGRLRVQADVYLKGARSSSDAAFRLGDGAASMSLCEYLVEMHSSMLRTLGPPNNPEKGSGVLGLSSWSFSNPRQSEPQSKPPEILDWSAAVLTTYHFRQEASQITNTLPGRQPKLVRQITELYNLPEGIYVRVMDARPDMLKAVIVGPKDTPYEGGLFEYETAPPQAQAFGPVYTDTQRRFDVLAPWDFPNSPPKVILKTTGGGRVRFNPNLYSNGKVCLSLINTWAGNAVEQWVPGSSTLLQIFVSIQSMIFVECPYTNEPGREGLASTPASLQHKQFVRANTIRWAMVDWMQDGAKRGGIWKDVVKAHFTRNAELLQRLIRDSAAANPAIWHFHGNHGEDVLLRIPDGGVNLEKEFDKCLSLLN
ncbi:MAG: hypothetical protein M1839_006134 [Geoglossum umbratile]|nr:MAG: hypothetical protein M1839_006134 [Geoglossum umbratile]